MGKMNWSKARKFRDFEEKYEPGTVMQNGRVVGSGPRNGLAAKAAKAEREWLGGIMASSGNAGRAKSRRKPSRSPQAADETDHKKLLHQVVMAVINAGHGDILKGIDDLNAYYHGEIPTVADVIGGRPSHAIITGGITLNDKVYSFTCARLVSSIPA
jgi:hypothetical protein